ncbi:hypothetical protein E3P84_01196 [Wallemia ichthyophaga]|nr:hypothetical protein E3P84_01196 [Wallemia ichthyophaga]TIB42473.1 hypothetical protein E3P83_01232 [Wallemia ichthyophaga]
MRRRICEHYTASLKVEASKILDIKSNALSTSSSKTSSGPTRALPVAPRSYLPIYGTRIKNRIPLSYYYRQLSMYKKYSPTPQKHQLEDLQQQKRPRYSTRCLATQLRSGHYPTTKSYRYRFRLIDSPKYSAYGTEDTISHRIFILKRHIMARITLRRKITKINIRFELGPILRNTHSLQALYEFFKPQLTTYQRYSDGSM